ncbi:hypothetical protein [Methylovulum psychrotolerans]|jgi:hypothetical protein|uniref:Sorbitol dehydrogenase n=1 Tax=Methylovulum psychrotolerans TaxID=1704499 RepID=A0A1Z4BXP5_9GAMM|nr:hypothetical protein [Methylovulum psychrotolerans]ASF46031.1 hypothetical protein CEK71_08025 [Methylovulum psychrotolerans]MBT9099725.1 hypothetical protein [Methylovulum psychrotolerans]POZ50149.1 hypothetical protein AADEFJLK_04046 [Methylovulum psychrotolerans]
MFDLFIDFSVTLTGFSTFRLQGTGMAAPYFETVQKIIGPATLDELLLQYQAIVATANGDAATLDNLLRNTIFNDPKFGPVTRNIIKLWFVGTWYQLPKDWWGAYGTGEQGDSFVVSPAAYTEGLLWPTVGVTPAGAKAPGYDSWVNAPVFS